MTRIARVTDKDTEAATELADRLARTATGFTDMLFNPSTSGLDRYINPRHRAAVGVILTWNVNRRDMDEGRLLSVIRATGRTHWTHEGPITPIGVVMLGGEVAARYLYHRLVREHGPYGLEPLAAAIATLWRLPGEEPPYVQGHPPMALLRLTTGPYKGLFHHVDIEAMRYLAYALPGSGRSDQQKLMCVARIADAAIRHQNRFHRDDLAAVREAVLTARATGLPQPVLTTTAA